jgi:hypothetical protein
MSGFDASPDASEYIELPHRVESCLVQIDLFAARTRVSVSAPPVLESFWPLLLELEVFRLERERL